jgi:tetratricopeptide (TPR) repeat protein
MVGVPRIARRSKSTGAEMVVPTFLAFQCDAYLAAHQIDKALISIEEGLKLSKRMEELYYDAELYRLRGEALLQQQRKHQSTKANSKEAESCFLQAIKIAREQKAKSLELRATTSLARLQQTTGMEKEARKALAKICGWFTEGFDTPDFKNAKSLLNELS